MIKTMTPAVAALAADIEAIVRPDTAVSSLDTAVSSDGSARIEAIDTARSVAGVLRRAMAGADLLTADDQRSRMDCYCQHVLYVDPDGAFSIVALVWLPGQRTPIHDHISWCVVGVYAGAEEETLYRLVEGNRGNGNGRGLGDGDGGDGSSGNDSGGYGSSDGMHLVRTGHAVNGEGTTTFFAPPGDIHEVCNSTDGKVVSIHVYGADISVLGSSIRRRYDLPVRVA